MTTSNKQTTRNATTHGYSKEQINGIRDYFSSLFIKDIKEGKITLEKLASDGFHGYANMPDTKIIEMYQEHIKKDSTSKKDTEIDELKKLVENQRKELKKLHSMLDELFNSNNVYVVGL